MTITEEFIMNQQTEQIYRQQFIIGKGAIEPKRHIIDGEYTWETVDQFESDVLNDPTLFKQTACSVPILCADGRTTRTNGASAIGGSFSMVMADSLGPRRFYDEEISAKDHALNLYENLKINGFPVGGHDDDHSAFPSCGCGGEDKLDFHDTRQLSILGYLCNNSEDIKKTLESLVDSKTGESLGINIYDDEHEVIVNNALTIHQRTKSNSPYVTNGNDLRAAMIETVGDRSVETLAGEHKEVLALLDLREGGFVLDRNELSNRYNQLMQAFYINVASLNIGASVIYDKAVDISLAYKAALYYNVAATAVLAGPSLRILTLK